jgi:hypothetical protein
MNRFTKSASNCRDGLGPIFDRLTHGLYCDASSYRTVQRIASFLCELDNRILTPAIKTVMRRIERIESLQKDMADGSQRPQRSAGNRRNSAFDVVCDSRGSGQSFKRLAVARRDRAQCALDF